MEHSPDTTFETDYQAAKDGFEEIGFIDLVQDPAPLQITGVESLSVGESFNLFFKEFSTNIDRKLVAMSKSVHTVDIDKLRKAIKQKDIIFSAKGGVEIMVPENYEPGLANMMAHTKGVVDGVYLVTFLKAEGARLYDWLKVIIQRGRVETTFRWSISNFDSLIDKGEHFVRNLSDGGRAKTCPLGQVYVNFNEMFEVMETFNAVVKTLGARDAEQASRELTNVYELGQLLVAKIKANELVLDKKVILDIEMTINRFVELTNLCGAMMTLLNELSAVLRAQIYEVAAL